MGREIEEALVWLKYGAPAESEKPWAPIETSLPDPEILPLRPRFLSSKNVMRFMKWSCRSPIDFLLHCATWILIIILMFANLPIYYQRNCNSELILQFSACGLCFLALYSLWKRFLLYREAIHFQIRKGANLASITQERLRYRRWRAWPIFFFISFAIFLFSIRRQRESEDLYLCLCCISDKDKLSEKDKEEISSSKRSLSSSFLLNSHYIASNLFAAILLCICTFVLSSDPIEDAASRLLASQSRRTAVPSSHHHHHHHHGGHY
mmetsp:Transcript_13616/g.20307  ORF Transcript_13616/g.20307 Transcript_13616/m.20307 type:complete len:265 (-) Transcript_13616:145-939(-)